MEHAPLKINMEPTNHPIEKENHLNQTTIFGFNMLTFQGVSQIKLHKRCLARNKWSEVSRISKVSA